MKVFVVLSFIALAVAKPQGYSYNQPSNGFSGSQSAGISGPISAPSFGLNAPASAPAPSFSGSSGSSFSGSSSFSSGSSAPSFSTGPSASFSAGPSFSAAAPSTASFSAGPSFSAAGPSAASFSAGPSFPAAGPSASFSAGPSFGSQSFQSFAQQPQAQAVVQKHIYVHVPPPSEEEFAQPHHAVAPVQQQKHYKIIFIKAPSAPSVSRQQLQQLAQPQTEEKTLVYVLVKKPESFSEISQTIQPAPITPSKPEVYFIKYKAQKEQQHFAPAPIAPSPAAIAPSASIPLSSIESGSAEASFPISAQKPAPVYGPAAH